MTHRTSKVLSLDSSEIRAILLVAFILSFGLTFRMWGGDAFDFSVGLFNLVFVFLGMLVAVFLHEGAHKLYASLEGYVVKVQQFNAGLVVSVFVTLYSQGFVPLVTPNLLEQDARSDMRLHRWRKFENPGDMARIAAAGLVGSSLAILLFKTLYQFTGIALFMTIVLGALLHAVYSLIPWELINLAKLRYFQTADRHSPGDGLYIYWKSAKLYVFTLLAMIFYGGIALLTSTTSYVISLVLAGFTTWAYFKFR